MRKGKIHQEITKIFTLYAHNNIDSEYILTNTKKVNKFIIIIANFNKIISKLIEQVNKML